MPTPEPAWTQSLQGAPRPLSFPCPCCGNALQVDDALAGKKVRCPACQQVVPVPAQSEVGYKVEDTRGRQETLKPSAFFRRVALK
jgi:hypothetical protein